jgi:hypothetical protein
MVFSSHLFVFYFLPLALLVYYLLPMRGKHLSLTLFSYVFYGWANPWFVLLMFSSTLIDYVAGLVQADIGAIGCCSRLWSAGCGWRRPTARVPRRWRWSSRSSPT